MRVPSGGGGDRGGGEAGASGSDARISIGPLEVDFECSAISTIQKPRRYFISGQTMATHAYSPRRLLFPLTLWHEATGEREILWPVS